MARGKLKGGSPMVRFGSLPGLFQTAMVFGQIGKLLILFGGLVIIIGILMLFFDKIPLLGKLPGDIHIKKGNFVFYFPIVTSIILSILLTIILNLIGRGK
jgi:hypothetical protein